MKNLILAIAAIVIFIILEPINFIYVNFFMKKFHWKRLSGYYRAYAIGSDRFGNYTYRSLFNAVLIKEDGYKFGNFAETISSVLGKNQRSDTLTKTGKILVKILDTIDKDHCKKSILEL